MPLFGKRLGQQLKINGSYTLQGYDDNLEQWLESLRIPAAEFGPIFRGTKVKVTVQEPSKYNKRWTITHKEEGETDPEKYVTYTFEPGKCFTREIEESGKLEKIQCQSTASNVLECSAEVKDLDWNVSTKVMFTPDGISVIFTNTEANVSMTATYARALDPWATKKNKFMLLKML